MVQNMEKNTVQVSFSAKGTGAAEEQLMELRSKLALLAGESMARVHEAMNVPIYMAPDDRSKLVSVSAASKSRGKVLMTTFVVRTETVGRQLNIWRTICQRDYPLVRADAIGASESGIRTCEPLWIPAGREKEDLREGS